MCQLLGYDEVVVVVVARHPVGTAEQPLSPQPEQTKPPDHSLSKQNPPTTAHAHTVMWMWGRGGEGGGGWIKGVG